LDTAAGRPIETVLAKSLMRDEMIQQKIASQTIEIQPRKKSETRQKQ